LPRRHDEGSFLRPEDLENIEIPRIPSVHSIVVASTSSML